MDAEVTAANGGLCWENCDLPDWGGDRIRLLLKLGRQTLGEVRHRRGRAIYDGCIVDARVDATTKAGHHVSTSHLPSVTMVALRNTVENTLRVLARAPEVVWARLAASKRGKEAP